MGFSVLPLLTSGPPHAISCSGTGLKSYCNYDPGSTALNLASPTIKKIAEEAPIGIGLIRGTARPGVVGFTRNNCLKTGSSFFQARNAEYNPKRFAAVIMLIREPRTTALIFSSGKMVCTGAKSEEDSRMAARKYARIVQKLGFQVKRELHCCW